MDALAIEAAILVGCSMGGTYSLDAALVVPERVSGLVLIGSGLSGHTPGPPRCSQAVRKKVHTSARLDLPDTGHWPPLERPTVVTAAPADFARRTA